MVLRPDCADLPYFLRAYFAFKMGLPFGFSKCTRGGGGKAPHCPQWFSIQNAEAAAPAAAAGAALIRSRPRADFSAERTAAARRRLAEAAGLAASFGEFARSSPTASIPAPGAPRAADNNTDYYPGAAHAGDAAPGTVYADPYGHILMIVRRVPQTDGRGGRHSRGRRAARRHGGAQALLARQLPVRAGSRARRPRLQALPAGRARRNGVMRRLTNEEIAKNPQYARFLARSVEARRSRTSTTGWTT